MEMFMLCRLTGIKNMEKNFEQSFFNRYKNRGKMYMAHHRQMWKLQ